MKKIWIINLMSIALVATTTMKAQQTNDFYDDAPTHPLEGPTLIEIAGEIGNPGMVDIAAFPLRSLIVKEAVASGDSNRFTGAYRYDGYSLYDILNYVELKKNNEAEFPPIIDLYVTVENDRGESAIFSWGELYYPIHRHEVIIATQVARIVPSKTRDLWPLPVETKVVAGHDLVTERNISKPVRITIHSVDRSYLVQRELQPLFSPMITLYNGETQTGEISRPLSAIQKVTYESVFYGRGRGIHSTTPFHGVMLKEAIGPYFPGSAELLRTGYFIVASVDGYRGVFTFSEVFNRNDQAEVLLIGDPDNQDGGMYRLFPAADFFSDRAIKAVSEIRLIK